MAPTSIDGTEISGATIDGQDVSEITVDGDVVFTAIPQGVVDNFESTLYEDQGKTLSDNYFGGDSGELSEYVRSTSVSYEGSYSINADQVDSGFDYKYPKIFSTSGLPRYPVAGDTIHSYFRYSSDSNNSDRAAIYFGVENSDDYYFLNTRPFNQNEIVIGKRQGGSIAVDNESSITLNKNQWYRFVVDWGEDGTITGSIETTGGRDTQGIVSFNDTEYKDGGIGFGVGVKQSSRIYHDFMEIF